MRLTFRCAKIADIPLITQLAEKIWLDHYPAIITEAQINYMLESRYSAKVIREGMEANEEYFLAFADDRPVAYASIELDKQGYYLHKFYVDTSNHRKGIGIRFFDYLLSVIDVTKPLRLQVNRKNYKAINFYFKQGFVIESVGDFDIGGGYFMNDFVMLRKA